MRRPGYAAVRCGRDRLATVVSVHETHEEADQASLLDEEIEVLAVYYRPGSETPRPGDRLDIWREFSTHWLMASR